MFPSVVLTLSHCVSGMGVLTSGFSFFFFGAAPGIMALGGTTGITPGAGRGRI